MNSVPTVCLYESVLAVLEEDWSLWTHIFIITASSYYPQTMGNASGGMNLTSHKGGFRENL